MIWKDPGGADKIREWKKKIRQTVHPSWGGGVGGTESTSEGRTGIWGPSIETGAKRPI